MLLLQAKLRLVYRKVWSLQQQLKSPSLCTSPVFAQCCELLADWSHCDASCRSEARVCRGEADNLLRHTHSLLTFIRQHVGISLTLLNLYLNSIYISIEFTQFYETATMFLLTLLNSMIQLSLYYILYSI